MNAATRARIALRPFHTNDVAALQRAFADPEIVAWNPGGTGESAALAWMTERNDWSVGDHASWAVADPTSESLLGSVSVHKVSQDQRDAEIGYWVVPSARRRGVGTAAVLAGIEYAFTTLDLRRLVLLHAVENVGSCRVAARAGFRLEGELRESYRYPDGRYHDEHLHALLRSDLD